MRRSARSFVLERAALGLVVLALAAAGRRHPRADVRSTSDDDDRDAVQTAWRIHALLVDWVGKGDQKASFVLAVESAVAVGVVAASHGDPDNPNLLSALDSPLELWSYRLGAALIAVAIALVMAAVQPQLRRDRTGQDGPKGIVYFGDLRRWREPELSAALREREVLPDLSDQLIDLSHIAWKKHRRLQWSLPLAGSGALLVALAALADSNSLTG